MKKFIKVLAVASLAVLVLSFVSCSTYNKILKAYEKEGYTEISQDDSLVKALNASVKSVLDAASQKEESDIQITLHFLKSDDMLPDFACILEFKSSDELNEYIADNETLKGMLKDAQKSEYVNGNCILFPSSAKSLEIFKNA